MLFPLVVVGVTILGLMAWPTLCDVCSMCCVKVVFNSQATINVLVVRYWRHHIATECQLAKVTVSLLAEVCPVPPVDLSNLQQTICQTYKKMFVHLFCLLSVCLFVSNF